MRKLIVLTILVLLIGSVTVLAAQEQVGVTDKVTAVKTASVSARITAVQKNQYKETLRNYFTPVIHGLGIGFTDENYVTARWNIIGVRLLSQERIRTLIQESKQGNETDLDALRERIRNSLASSTQTVRKGRIRISGEDYALVNIVVSDGSATADIVDVPDYSACKAANTSAEDCETNSSKVGDLSLTKKTSVEASGEPNVWAGALNLDGTAYTFVTFVYPR